MSSLRELEAYQMPGEPSLIVEIVGAYLQESAVDAENLQTAVRTSDWQMLASSAHRLKGSSANVGAKSVVELCSALERDAKGGAVPNVAARVGKVLEVLDASCEVLKSERAKAGG